MVIFYTIIQQESWRDVYSHTQERVRSEGKRKRNGIWECLLRKKWQYWFGDGKTLRLNLSEHHGKVHSERKIYAYLLWKEKKVAALNALAHE